MYRRRFLAAGVAAAIPLAGCLSSASKPTPVGESYEEGGLTLTVPSVEVTDELVVDGPNGREELQARDSVYVVPWIRIENTGNSSETLPGPLNDMTVRYDQGRIRYVSGRYDEITVGGDAHRTYRSNYRERNGSIPAGAVVEGPGSVYRLPAGFDPTAASVHIDVGRRECKWVFEVAE